MKAEILKMLKEKAGFLSGQEICEKFHVSRTAVWKVIRQLEAEGYQINAVRNKGYCLEEYGDVLTEGELLSAMTTAFCGRHMVFRDQVDSTNNLAKRLAEEGAVHGTLILAECQTAGKGRRGKSWVSEPGVGVWMTLLLRPDLNPSKASMLTLTAAMAVCRAIEKTTGIQAEIKWPNDIVVNGKKVCGILTEMSAELEVIHYVVIGMGINANVDVFPPEVSQVATSLKLESGRAVPRTALIASVMEQYEICYEHFMKTGDMTLLLEEYNKKLVNQDREVEVTGQKGNFRGKALGIDGEGRLLVRLPEGELRKVVSGEVSVRGIYGYV